VTVRSSSRSRQRACGQFVRGRSWLDMRMLKSVVPDDRRRP
jgi:hypothetical protein